MIVRFTMRFESSVQERFPVSEGLDPPPLTGHNKFVRGGSTLSRVGGGGGYLSHHLSHETYRQNVLALKFELRQKYSAGKSQHC